MKIVIAIKDCPNPIYPAGTIWKHMHGNTDLLISPPNHPRVGLENTNSKREEDYLKTIEV